MIDGVYTGAVEGAVDEVVLRRIVEDLGRSIDTVYVTEGKANLLRRVNGFNQAARLAPWVVLFDLNSAECAPTMCRDVLPAPAPHMRFRIAVRAVEAWLLADRQRIAAFLGVRAARIPDDPDAVTNPKQTLVDVARHSRRRAIRDDMIPTRQGRRRVGPGYEARLIQFVIDDPGWRPHVAAAASESLRRCLEAVRA